MPGRKPLVALRDAGTYITKLPKAEHDAPEWQAAMQALLLVAERNGPTMLARIGMMRAINRLETKPTQAPCQRRAKAYRALGRPASRRAAFFLTRRVLSWRLSIKMEAAFCVETLEDALARHGRPEIFNTDQGAQFTGRLDHSAV